MLDHRTSRPSRRALTHDDLAFVAVAVALGGLLAYAVVWGAIGGYVLPSDDPRANAVNLARIGLGMAALLTVPFYSVWLIREAFDRAERAALRAHARAATQTATRLSAPAEAPARLRASGSLGG
jgi:fatty acid desaturase